MIILFSTLFKLEGKKNKKKSTTAPTQPQQKHFYQHFGKPQLKRSNQAPIFHA